MSFEFMPPELAAQLREQHAHQHMHQIDTTHKIDEFLHGLSSDHLELVEILLRGSSDNAAYAYYMIGRITGIQQSTHKICPCGDPEAHNPESLLPNEPDVQSTPDPLNVDADHEAQLKEWGLYINQSDGKLRCRKCGMQYPSLSDRQLRPKGIDGCSGCMLMGGQGQTSGPVDPSA